MGGFHGLNVLTGPPAAVLSAVLRGGPGPSQGARATFTTTNLTTAYPYLPSLMTEVVWLPTQGILDASILITDVLVSQGWATQGVTTVTGNYTTLATDAVILCNATGGALTVTLADATQPPYVDGQRYTVIKTDSSGNNVTVTGSAGQLIGGLSSVTLTASNAFLGVVFDGTTSNNWWTWAQSSTGSSPTGAAGGVLSGTYPNPGFAVPLTVSSGASTFGGLVSVTNTTSSPGNPGTGLVAAAAADRTLGIRVTGDTSSRLLVDSNGKHTWGTGSATGDTDLYRSGVGVLQTDTTFTGQVLTASGLTGATAASRYAGATASGAPGSGTFAVGDFVIDQTGKVWVCTVAGSPGTWVTLQFDATTPAATSTTGAVGSAATVPRRDHVHAQNYGGIFGDGSDGSVTFDGTATFGFASTTGSAPNLVYTLTRDVYATSLTVNASKTLNTGGWRIFVQGTFTNSGTVQNAGNNASGTNQGTGGGATTLGSLGKGPAGANGATGNGAAGTATNGAGFAGNSGGGGHGTTPPSTNTTGGSSASGGATGTSQYKIPTMALTGYGFIAGQNTSITGGPSGGSGGGDGTNVGGGGGGGGGPVVIFAWSAVNSGTINASGGNGGSPTTVATNGGCGGGGAGDGGVILVYTLSAWTAGTTNVAAGSPGTAVTNGSGTAANGGSGNSGSVLNQVIA